MARWDDIGLLWEDLPPEKRGGPRLLGPMPPIPESDWCPPTELPNLIGQPWIGLDCETWDPELNDHGPGWARGIGHIVGVSISFPGYKAYFPIRHVWPANGDPTKQVRQELNMNPERVLAWLRDQLPHAKIIIGANLLYDVGWLAHEGIRFNTKTKFYDVQYAEGLIDETARVALETIGWKYIKRGKKSEVLKEWAMSYFMSSERLWRADIYRCPITLAGPYAEDDAQMPYEILTKQWPQLVARGLLDLFEMECKLIPLLVAMRFQGISVDLEYAEQTKTAFGIRADDIHKQAEYIAGMSFNANAGDSLAAVFDKLGLPYGKTATGKPSFTADVLKAMSHPLPKMIIAERQLMKLSSTFIDGYILDAHIGGKVFASFHPMIGEFGGAKTGRFSGSDPNLQNIPVRTEEGRMLRKMFVKDRGHRRLKVGDYSQIEYRMLAHFATGEGADEVRSRYNNDPNLDYHELVSLLINQIGGFAVQVKKGLLPGALIGGIHLIREHIKTLNFAMVYGVGKDHLAEMLGVLDALAREIQKAFHKAVPFARSTMDAISAEVGQTGICTTILGRQTHFDLWEPAGYGNIKGAGKEYSAALAEWGPNLQRAYLYAATNYRLQGSAADVMKKAMVDCWEQGIYSYTGVPRFTVHDELGFSDPGNVPEDAWRELQRIMETTIPFSVPIKFDMGDGDNWLEAKGK